MLVRSVAISLTRGKCYLFSIARSLQHRCLYIAVFRTHDLGPLLNLLSLWLGLRGWYFLAKESVILFHALVIHIVLCLSEV
jgi:hypothetical protein